MPLREALQHSSRCMWCPPREESNRNGANYRVCDATCKGKVEILVDVELRTLPPDAVLLAFYILPDGTAIADFSEALATSIPSGIASEQLAVDSMARTLEASVPEVKRLRILIHGQEVETLAGHVDLTGTFVVNARLGRTPTTPAAAPAAGNVGVVTLPPLTLNGRTVKLAQR